MAVVFDKAEYSNFDYSEGIIVLEDRWYRVRVKEHSLFTENTYSDIVVLSNTTSLFGGDTKEVEKYITDNMAQLMSTSSKILFFHKGSQNDSSRASVVYEEEGGIHTCNITKLPKNRFYWFVDEEYTTEYKAFIKANFSERCLNYANFIKRIAKNHEGFTFEQALEYMKSNKEEFAELSSRYNEYDQNDPIISIKKPVITRKNGNNNKDTFDFVAVEVMLRSDLQVEDMAAYIKENLEDFDQRVRENICDATAYVKYNVPVEYLSLYSIGTRGKSCVEFKYELREI